RLYRANRIGDTDLHLFPSLRSKPLAGLLPPRVLLRLLQQASRASRARLYRANRIGDTDLHLFPSLRSKPLAGLLPPRVLLRLLQQASGASRARLYRANRIIGAIASSGFPKTAGASSGRISIRAKVRSPNRPSCRRTDHPISRSPDLSNAVFGFLRCLPGFT